MRKIKIEFPEYKTTVYARLQEDDQPEMCEELWGMLAEPQPCYVHNTLSTGDFCTARPIPPFHKPELGNQTNPLGGADKVPMLDDLHNGDIAWFGWHWGIGYGDNTEPMVCPGPIVAKVEPQYLEDFHYAGNECWNSVYLYHTASTAIFSRGEE